MKPTARFQTAADAFHGWRGDVLSGEPPVLFPVGQGDLQRIEWGPGRVSLFGGAPGAGKTAFTMQLAVDALRLTPALRAVVCNIEMSPAALLDRQLARLSGIDLGTIRHRRFDASHGDRLDQALATIETLADRLAFVSAPFDLGNIFGVCDAYAADLVVLDYIQRIKPPGEYGDKRSSVDATMDLMRQAADAGLAVVVVAAVSRGKDSKGRSSYAADALSLASFRESSELEFGADDAFILAPDKRDPESVTLRHLKARHAEPRDIALSFDRPRQRFTPIETAAATKPKGPPGKADAAGRSALAALWQRTKPAGEDA